MRTIQEKHEKKEFLLKTKVKELKGYIVDLQIKEKIQSQARARSELNERNTIIRQNLLEKDYN